MMRKHFDAVREKRESAGGCDLKVYLVKPVILWDEAFTTKDAKQLQLEKGISQREGRGHQDEMAAVMLLEDYLEKTNP